MASVAASSVARPSAAPSSANAAPPRMRPDLHLRPAATDPGSWVVHDPVAERYYELGSEEKFLLEQLDGRRSWGEIRAAYERAFAPRRFDPAEVTKLLAMFEAEGLLLIDVPGRGETLRRRSEALGRRERRRRYGNLLAIRLPGIDPEPLLARLAPWIDPLLRPTVLAAAAVGVAATFLAALGSLRRIVADRETAADFFTPANVPLLLAALALAKTLHEAAHALACRRLGGRCREIGVYLLCGAPCLYADVTSMWGVPSRARRIAVDVAGMAAELFLAAGAFWVWSATEPGLLHSICLNLLIVCSVGTLAVNANPLLRYDGYFLLSDLLGIGNLRERADGALYRRLSDLLTAKPIDRRRGRRPSEPAWLAWFGLASAAYRLLIVVGLAWLVHEFLAPAGLATLADAAALCLFWGAVVAPALRTGRRLRHDARRRGTVRPAALRVGGLVAVVAGVLWYPWPASVSAPAVVGGREARTLYVTAAGRLIDAVAAGMEVRTGDVVATLDDPDLRREVVRLQGELARRTLELSQLERRRVGDPQAAESLPTLGDARAAVAEQLRLREQDLERLVLRAPRDGTIGASPTGPRRRDASEANAVGAPLDPAARGMHLPVGTAVCTIADPRQAEAVAWIGDDDVARVQVGAKAEVRLLGDMAPRSGHVATIEAAPVGDVPPQLVAAGAIAVRRSTGSAEPTSAAYRVRIDLEPSTLPVPEGAVATAEIETPPRSLAARARHRLATLLHWKW